MDPSATRISIRALSDCWIQMRASDQSIVFSRVLKVGRDLQGARSRTGLSLRTGNAGALEIAVDGKTGAVDRRHRHAAPQCRARPRRAGGRNRRSRRERLTFFRHPGVL